MQVLMSDAVPVSTAGRLDWNIRSLDGVSRVDEHFL